MKDKRGKTGNERENEEIKGGKIKENWKECQRKNFSNRLSNGCVTKCINDTPPSQHPVSGEGVFLFFLIYCKLVHSYTIKHLT